MCLFQIHTSITHTLRGRLLLHNECVIYSLLLLISILLPLFFSMCFLFFLSLTVVGFTGQLGRCITLVWFGQIM